MLVVLQSDVWGFELHFDVVFSRQFSFRRRSICGMGFWGIWGRSGSFWCLVGSRDGTLCRRKEIVSYPASLSPEVVFSGLVNACIALP